MVTIHFGVRAVPQKILGFCSRMHLAAMLPTIAMEGRSHSRFVGCNHVFHIAELHRACRPGFHAPGVLVVSIGTQGDYNSKWNEAPQQTGFVGAFGGFAQAIRFFGRAGGRHNVLCLLLPVLADPDLEQNTLAEPGPLAVPGKGRDVGEYLRPPLSGRDESKAAIIVPFCKCAFYAHKYSSLAPLIAP